MNMNLKEELEMKYRAYEADGHAVFVVTLSTYVRSELFGLSDRMRHFWDHHFIYRVREQLPYKGKAKLDHDYVIERRPAFHYHGWIALPRAYAHCIWKDGALDPRLERALRSFHKRGNYRPFCVNEFLIEPLDEVKGGVTAWAKYISKTSDAIPSTS